MIKSSLSVFFSLCLCLFLSLSFSVFLCLSFFLFLYLSLSLSLSLFFSLSPSLSLRFAPFFSLFSGNRLHILPPESKETNKGVPAHQKIYFVIQVGQFFKQILTLFYFTSKIKLHFFHS